MTLGTLLSAVYEEVGYQSTPATAVTTRITRYLNEGVRAVLGEPGLARLADSDGALTFASVANQARYVLAEAVARVIGITDQTNKIALSVIDLSTYRTFSPDPTSVTGLPVRYVPIGRVAVAVQPANASELYAVSTSAADTTQTIYVEGILTGGYRRTASVQLNGTTAVSLSSAITSFIEVEDVYVSAACAGTVTLLEDSGLGTELARITIGATRPRYFGFYLWPTPTAATTYTVDYRRELTDLANTTDEPPLPTDYHPMLVAYGVMREAELKANTALYVQAKTRYDRFLSRLKYATQSMRDELPVAGRGTRRLSRLGGSFPADWVDSGTGWI